MGQILHITADIRNEGVLNQLAAPDSDSVKIIALTDYLTDGPLKDGDTPFDELRKTYRNTVHAGNTSLDHIEEGNVARIMSVSTLLSNEEDASVVYWMGANAIDITGYFFLLHFLRKHMNRISVVNIAGLPFIDDSGKLFFPNYISQLPPQQVHKALKLCREITPSEFEVDSEEWKKLREENAPLRVLDGNKKIRSVEADFYDSSLKQMHKEGAKTTRTSQHAFNKYLIAASPEFIESRLSQLTKSQPAEDAVTGQNAETAD